MIAPLYRQGDVLIAAVDTIPPEAKRLRHGILAAGDTTGHRHMLERARGVRLLSHAQQIFIEVDADRGRVVHPEHGPIELPRGRYRVWRQREQRGSGVFTVSD